MSLSRFLSLAVFATLALNAYAAKSAKSEKKAVAEPVEIALAHNFGSNAEGELEKLVERFNASSRDGKVKLVRPAAGAAPAPLNLLHRSEVAGLSGGKTAFRPLYAVMKEAKVGLDAGVLTRDLKVGSTDEKGRLVALPLAYATPVLYYNKNAFRKAGLDPERAPATWQEVQEFSGKLAQNGVACPYTTSWPTWIHVDNVSALSGVPVATAKGDLTFNGMVQVKHIAKLSTWQRARYFRVFGRGNEADEHFKSGECAMLTSDSTAHVEFREAQGVELGVAPLPYYDDVYGGRQHTLADGAALWVGGGYKPAQYKLAAKFVAYMLTPEVQVQLVRTYGMLPLTAAGRSALKSEVLRDRDRTLEVAFASLQGAGGASPLRIAALDPVRIIVDEELEKVWSEKEPPKAALDNAATRGNAVLKARPTLKRVLPF